MVVTVKSPASADLLADTVPHRPGRPPVPGPSRSPAGAGRAGRHLLAGLAAAAVALAGCSSGASTDGTSINAKVALTFKLNTGPGTPVIKHWTLTCEPAGGSQPDASAACAALIKLTRPFAPHHQGVACPMILRSNRRILVTGTWLGTNVHRLVVDGGCDLALFTRLDKIFR